LVRHARPYIRRYWAFMNRRAIGMSMAIFGILLSIGVIFTLVLDQFFIQNAVGLLVLWLVLFIMIILVALASIIKTHVEVAKLMNKEEYDVHSKNIAIFLLAMGFGSLAFVLPMLIISSEAALVVLFSTGGILFLLYVLLALVFGHKYHEIGFASVFIWAVFIAGVFMLTKPYIYNNPPLFETLAFLISTVAIVVVFSITGLVMVHNASNEFLKELERKKYK